MNRENKKGVEKKLIPEVEDIFLAPSFPYITGSGYRYLCDYVYDDYESFDLRSIEQFDGMNIFIKTEQIIDFGHLALPKITKNFKLYTHNSDTPIISHPTILDILNNKKLIEWHAQNVMFKHKKLKSIPIGLPNKIWKGGDTDLFDSIREKDLPKDNLLYCNFDLGTNKSERLECLSSIGLKMDPKVEFEVYLENIAKSYFIISPNGNGVDCHRHWEALYLKTIPIVTNSVNIENFPEMPFLTLNKWDEYKSLDLSPELYNHMWANFDLNKIFIGQ
jgi:hypothetical protein